MLADETARRRFRREAEALSRLNHAHIATVHDFDSSDGIDFLVMEYVPGPDPVASTSPAAAPGEGDRHARRRRGRGAGGGARARRRPPRSQARQHHRHAEGPGEGAGLRPGAAVGHRRRHRADDDAGGRAGSRGRCRTWRRSRCGARRSTRARTSTRSASCSSRWRPAGGRSTTRRPGGSPTRSCTRRVTPPTALQPGLNPELERIVVKCLERDPENRYQSAKEVAIDLRRLGSPTTTHQPSHGARRPVSRSSWRSGWAWRPSRVAGCRVLAGQRNQDDRPAATTAEGIASIVALPSKIVAQASDQFLTDAIPNTISAHLTQVKGLETKMPPSSVEVERVRGDLGKLADAYGVSAFVLTSLTADTDRLVLNVQLVEARSRRLLWSRDFEGRRDGYLALARGAAEELRGAVRPQAAAVVPQSTTSNSAAELAYQRGMHHFNRYNNQHEQKDFDQGLAAFQEALTLEPRMADAAAGIAWLHVFAIEASTPVEQGLPLMRQWGQPRWRWTSATAARGRSRRSSEFLATPSRQRDALVAALRGATYGPRDAFAVNVVGVALRGNASSLCLASMQEAARLDPLYLYPPPQHVGNAASTQSSGGIPGPRRERAAHRAGHADRADQEGAGPGRAWPFGRPGRAHPDAAAPGRRGPQRRAAGGDGDRGRRDNRKQRRRKARRARPARAAGPESLQPIHGVSAGPRLARDDTAAPPGRSPSSNATPSVDASPTTSCACRRTSRRSPPASGSSARSASRALSSTTPSRCSRRPTRDRNCRLHASAIDRSAAHARHPSAAGQPASVTPGGAVNAPPVFTTADRRRVSAVGRRVLRAAPRARRALPDPFPAQRHASAR